MSSEAVSTVLVETTPEVTPAVPVVEAPETEVEAPKTEDEQKPEKKDGFQKAIDRQTRKFYEQKARADSLEAQLRQNNSGSQIPAPNQNAEPDRSKFESDVDYNRALIQHEAKKIAAETIAESRHREQAQAIKNVWDKDVAAVRKTSEDFDEVLQDFLSSPHLTPAVDKAILASERPAAISEYLGRNEDEAARIAGLSDFRAAIEIGKIELKLTAAPGPAKKVSAAPAPIVPIAGKGGDTGIDPEKESPKEYAARRNKEIAERNRGKR